MKLYGTPPTRAIRVVWLLNELGLEYETITVDISKGEHLTPEFLSLNPAAKLPVLVDGDVVLTESVAIPLYLAEKHPEKQLIPAAIADRAQMYRWLFFLVSEIEAPLWRIARQTSFYSEQQRSQAEIDQAGKECREMLTVLESHMQGRDHFVGSTLTVADLVAAYTLDWAREAELLDDSPTLLAFVEKMYRRSTAPPTIKEAFAALRSD